MMNIFISRVDVVCPFCGAISSVDVEPTELTMAYFSGDLSVQKAFPYLSATKREMLITGLCEDCQEELFD